MKTTSKLLPDFQVRRGKFLLIGCNRWPQWVDKGCCQLMSGREVGVRVVGGGRGSTDAMVFQFESLFNSWFLFLCSVSSRYFDSTKTDYKFWGNLFLAYGWRVGNLNWPISIQQVGKIHCPHVNVSWQERHWNQVTFLIGDWINYSLKGIYNSQNHFTFQKVKNMKHLVSPSF